MFPALASVLFAVLLAGPPAHPSPADEAREERTVSPLFVVHYSTGPAWIEGRPFSEQPGAGDHSAHLRALREEGEIVLGARYAQVGMIVLRAASEEAARAAVDEDPAVRGGLFAVSVAAFQPFFDGCVP